MLRSFRRTTALLALTAAALACGPGTRHFTADDEAAVAAKFNDTPGFFLSGAADSWVSLFAADGVLQPSNAPAVTGHDALRTWFNAFPPIESVSFSAVTVHGAGDMAWGTSNYSLKLKDAPIDTGKQLLVARRTAAGTWEVVAVSFNSDLPVAAPPPAMKK